MKHLVLYADDDADDRLWASEAYLAIDANVSLCFVENGQEVLHYLQTLSEDCFPSLIILDLNMPQLDGRRTLQLLKENPRYRHIPVAIVSTSSNNNDREVCQQLGAALFLVKPNTYRNWEHTVAQLMPLIG